MDAPPAVAKAIQADGRVVITAEARINPSPPGSWILAPPLSSLKSSYSSYSLYSLYSSPMPTPHTLIITGASRGIGAAIALKAGRSDYRVVVNYAKDRRAADQIVDQIR
jgi:hypothetical protein